MEKGIIVEQGNCVSLFKKPEHPYTVKLINSNPSNKRFKSASSQIILKNQRFEYIL